jgi:hypothetical protein
MTELLFLRWRDLSRGERLCLAVLAALVAGWLFMPPLAQDARYYTYADQRAWLGVPNAADVLSNLAFLAVAAFGAATLRSRRRGRMTRTTEAALWCVVLGFVATAAGSASFHSQPNVSTLTWDMLGMALIFTGVLGTALAQRVGDNVARVGLAVIFELGVASVIWWRVTADLSPWIVMQAGGIAALVLWIVFARGRDDPFPWGWVLAWYAVAKVAEFGDQAIWNATDGVIGGHALKHVLAAIAGATVFLPLVTKVRRVGARSAFSAPSTHSK